MEQTKVLPTWQHKKLSLYHADCMDIMRQFPDKHFDLAIVDPPYGIDWMKQIQNPNESKNWKVYEFKKWDKSAPKPEYFEQLFRVSTNQIIWGANYMVENLRSSPCWVIWDKEQEFSGAVFEMAWTSFLSPAKAFRMSRVEAYANQNKIHPTQKPVALYRWLLAKYAQPGQRILDTHLGSGSHAIAAHYADMEFTGIELDADYFTASCERIERETSQLTLGI
jgi:site-specific DNA-methyltransferase (adenine-specific)